MDHQEAIGTQAAERYTLDDLTPAEREAFEEHYFTCEECADAVRTCTLLAVNTKALAKDEATRPNKAGQVVAMAPRPARPAWREWTAAAAAVLLLGIIGYQNAVTIPKLAKQVSSPGPLESVLLRPQARAAARVVHTHGNTLGLDLELDSSNRSSSYEVTVRSAAGQAFEPVRFLPFNDAPSKDGTLRVRWPSEIKPGDYEILVRDAGGNSTQVFPLHVER
jgi:anti-sigma factor RsiW